MKLAIVTLTKGGLATAEKVKRNIDTTVDIYTKDKFQGTLKSFVGVLFKEYKNILFIMATGIVVRVISPYIKDKTRDPAIMVMDEQGRFVISLLSGHLGGANAYTEKIAKGIGAIPVITTASDVLGLISIDMLAKRLNCKMESLKKAKEITADIVNGKRVGICTDIPLDIPDYNNIKIVGTESINNFDSIIYITNKIIDNTHSRSIQLTLKNIVVGVGCRRGIKGEDMIHGIKALFDEIGLKIESIKKLSSVDIKKDEQGILQASEHFRVPVEFIDRTEIRMIEENFDVSEFVRRTIGVGGVSEPCGYISSHNGRCLMKKRKFQGFTLSVWEERLNE
ncbi:cobalt-precorrin 5A hydrolase [Clostridiisalibacter paucivorans]|uniref:cobalt-precorrin 5A hydrolase n=1 Tax=Clostridiisalibacter paucivorans TaxID=408753 RepID=UPI00047C5CF4|nr:cobalt-precorrin 5A hydrolase [Clostridiisalibacter paucivorans]